MEIRKRAEIWRPLSVVFNGRLRELASICFYSAEGVYARARQGWFDGQRISVDEPIVIETRKPLVRKVKVDFSADCPFVVTDSEKALDGTARVMLYIPVEDMDFAEPVYAKEGGSIFRFLAAKNDARIAISEAVFSIGDAYEGEHVSSYDVSRYVRENLCDPVLMSGSEFEAAVDRVRQMRRDCLMRKAFIKAFTVEDYLAIQKRKENKK